MVVGTPIVLRLVDEAQVREFGGVGSDARGWIGLIDAVPISQVGAVSSDVAHIQRKVVAEGVLDAEAVVIDVGRGIIRIHCLDGARLVGSASKYGTLRENGGAPRPIPVEPGVNL